MQDVDETEHADVITNCEIKGRAVVPHERDAPPGIPNVFSCVEFRSVRLTSRIVWILLHLKLATQKPSMLFEILGLSAVDNALKFGQLDTS